jgi:transposase-like protein
MADYLFNVYRMFQFQITKKEEPAMTIILPAIVSLTQHLESIKNNLELYRPARCPGCGRCGVWRHGHYNRKANRENNEPLNPIPVPRFFCPHCNTTCSVLPECIAPRRWYLWKIQQIVLMLILAGNSINATAKKVLPSRRTISRWIVRLKNHFHFHRDVLCAHFSEFGLASNFALFWKTCLDKISLGRAMYLCHVSGVNIL